MNPTQARLTNRIRGLRGSIARREQKMNKLRGDIIVTFAKRLVSDKIVRLDRELVILRQKLARAETRRDELRAWRQDEV